jgi:hypothetical protein
MKNLALSILAAAINVPAFAHHSDAGLDMESLVTVEGTINEFIWRNPHVYFTVDTIGDDGQLVQWSVQMGSTISVSRNGWNRDTLRPGDKVVVNAHPAINGRPYGILDSLEKEGGIESGDIFVEPEVTVSAPSLEGRWMAKFSEVPAYPGGIDGFFLANMEFTEKGHAARDSFDPLSDTNPETECIGRPLPGMIVSSTRYPIEIEFDDAANVIMIRGQYWDEERTVYMDGREHPAPEVRYLSGHSVGHWDGDTLIIDTRNFSDHRSPYQIGLPSGGRKHIVERYRLIENGTRIAVDFVLEDPEYLARPMIHARELIYVPQIEMTPFDCDPEATRMFMRTLD